MYLSHYIDKDVPVYYRKRHMNYNNVSPNGVELLEKLGVKNCEGSQPDKGNVVVAKQPEKGTVVPMPQMNTNIYQRNSDLRGGKNPPIADMSPETSGNVKEEM